MEWTSHQGSSLWTSTKLKIGPLLLVLCFPVTRLVTTSFGYDLRLYLSYLSVDYRITEENLVSYLSKLHNIYITSVISPQKVERGRGVTYVLHRYWTVSTSVHLFPSLSSLILSLFVTQVSKFLLFTTNQPFHSQLFFHSILPDIKLLNVYKLSFFSRCYSQNQHPTRF